MKLSNMKKERSRAYPAIPLGEALARIESINKNLGINGQFNRESIAIGMGYTSLNGASARRVAALVHYGLLNRDKDQYYLSQLAKQYLLPVNDGDKDEAIREAALSPTLFAEIYESFKGQVIPKQFVNRLIQEFGIQQKAAPDVEKIFKSTVEMAGIMQSNGILSSSTTPIAPQSDTTTDLDTRDSQSINHVDTQSIKNSKSLAPTNYLSVDLPSGLVVCYSQDLASAFAFGEFAKELKALDDVVAKCTTPAPSTISSIDNKEEV